MLLNQPRRDAGPVFLSARSSMLVNRCSMSIFSVGEMARKRARETGETLASSNPFLRSKDTAYHSQAERRQERKAAQ